MTLDARPTDDATAVLPVPRDGGAGDAWFSVGASEQPDAVAATTEAVGRALAGRHAAMVLLFVTPFLDFATVAATAHSTLPATTRLVGCTTAGEIGEGTAGSGRVVAVALGGVEVGVEVGDLSLGARAAGVRAAAAIDTVTAPHRALLLVGDGFTVQRSEIVRGAYGHVGASVPLVGGCAGDEMALEATSQTVDGEVLAGVVVGVALGAARPLVVGVGHGWRRVGDEPVVVTASDGTTIDTLDDEPALDRFLDLVGVPAADRDDEAAFRAHALRHTFGLPRPGGEEVRAVIGADFARRTLVCSDVPQGTTVWLMSGDAASVQSGTEDAARQVLAQLGGATPTGVLAFDCIARRAILGAEGVQEEVALLADRLQAPVGGFYTYGEFARTRGSRGVHNATLVLLALG